VACGARKGVTKKTSVMTSPLPSLERLRLGPSVVPTGAPKQMGGEDVLEIDDTVYWYVYPNVPRSIVHPVQVRILSQKKELRPGGVYVMVYTVVVVDEDGDVIIDDDNHQKTIQQVRRDDLSLKHPTDVEDDAEPEPLPDAASDADSNDSEPYEIEGLPPPQRGITLPRTLQDPLSPPPPPAQPPKRDYEQGGKPRDIDPNDKGYYMNRKNKDRFLGSVQKPQGKPSGSDDEDGFGPYREDEDEEGEASTSRTKGDKNPEKRRRIQEFTPAQRNKMKRMVETDGKFGQFNNWFAKYLLPLRNLQSKLYTRKEKLEAKKAAFKVVQMLVKFIRIQENLDWLLGSLTNRSGLLHNPSFAIRWNKMIKDMVEVLKRAAGLLRLKGTLPGLDEILLSKEVQRVLFCVRSDQNPDKNTQRKNMIRALGHLEAEVEALKAKVLAMKEDEEDDDQQGQGMANTLAPSVPAAPEVVELDEDDEGPDGGEEDDLAGFRDDEGEDGDEDRLYA